MTNFSTPADALAHKAITLELRQLYHFCYQLRHCCILHFPCRKSSQPDEATGPERCAGVKRLSGMCNDHSDQSNTLSSLHDPALRNCRALAVDCRKELSLLKTGVRR